MASYGYIRDKVTLAARQLVAILAQYGPSDPDCEARSPKNVTRQLNLHEPLRLA